MCNNTFIWFTFIIFSNFNRREVKMINVNSCFKGTSQSTLMFTNLTTLFFTLIMLYIGGPDAEILSAELIFLIIYYYYIMQLSVTYQLPNAVKCLRQLSVSVKNIEVSLQKIFLRTTIFRTSKAYRVSCFRNFYFLNK